MSLKGNLVTGIIDKPVTLRGVHDENSFSNEELYKVYRIKMYDALLKWCVKEKIALTRIASVLKLLWDYRYRYGKNFLGRFSILDSTCSKISAIFENGSVCEKFSFNQKKEDDF